MALSVIGFAGLVLGVLLLRAVTIYAAARILTVDQSGLMAKSGAIGILGGLVVLPLAFIPLFGLIVFLIDYMLIKEFFDLTRLVALLVVLISGFMAQVIIFFGSKIV